MDQQHLGPIRSLDTSAIVDSSGGKVGRPLLVASKHRNQQSALPEAAIEREQTEPRLCELDGDLDRLLLAGGRRSAAVAQEAR